MKNTFFIPFLGGMVITLLLFVVLAREAHEAATKNKSTRTKAEREAIADSIKLWDWRNRLVQAIAHETPPLPDKIEKVRGIGSAQLQGKLSEGPVNVLRGSLSDSTSSDVATSLWILMGSFILIAAFIVSGALISRRHRNRIDHSDSKRFQALLEQFASAISQIASTPRRIKRFGSKARLQNSLLRKLANQGGFSFTAQHESLVFMLLLVLEDMTAQEYRGIEQSPADSTDPPPPRKPPFKKAEDEFFSLLEKELKQTELLGKHNADDSASNADQKALRELEADRATLLNALKDSTNVKLLKQFYLLNRGQLV